VVLTDVCENTLCIIEEGNIMLCFMLQQQNTGIEEHYILRKQGIYTKFLLEGLV